MQELCGRKGGRRGGAKTTLVHEKKTLCGGGQFISQGHRVHKRGRRGGAKKTLIPNRKTLGGGGLGSGQVQKRKRSEKTRGFASMVGRMVIGHGKSPSQESLESRECLESRDCDVIQCNKKWHFPDYCTEKKPQEVPDDSKKEMRCGERAQSYKMVMRWT